MTTVAIIGAGPLGRRLALAAARAGYRVFLEDVMPAKLEQAARESVDEAVSGVEFVSTVEDAVREADLAIDCVPDELESKLEILWLMDRMAPPRTVLATPTIALSIADLASCTYRTQKCVGIGLDPRSFSGTLGSTPDTPIALRTTEWTAPDAIDLVRGFWERLGFSVKVARDESS